MAVDEVVGFGRVVGEVVQLPRTAVGGGGVKVDEFPVALSDGLFSAFFVKFEIEVRVPMLLSVPGE